MAADRKGSYDVGYGKPPEHSRFKNGTSGNPRGRPPAARNLASLLTKNLYERVTITENGRHRSVSKLEVTLKRLINLAASGDLRAINTLLNFVHLVEQQQGVKEVQVDPSADDQSLMQDIFKRIARLAKEGNDDQT